jgi:hypothetical protein
MTQQGQATGTANRLVRHFISRKMHGARAGRHVGACHFILLQVEACGMISRKLT